MNPSADAVYWERATTPSAPPPAALRQLAGDEAPVAAFWAEGGLSGEEFYHNALLDWHPRFVSDLIAAESSGGGINRDLNCLLQTYDNQAKALRAEHKECQARESWMALEKGLWQPRTDLVSGRAHCQDGQSLEGSHSFLNPQWAGYPALKRWRAGTRQWRACVEEDLVLAQYEFRNLTRRIELSVGTLWAPDQEPNASDIRDALAALFRAFRRLGSEARHQGARQNLVAWLGALTSHLYLVASVSDHLWVLNHVVRCPDGVVAFLDRLVRLPSIQLVPEQSDFHAAFPLLDLSVTALHIVLTPPEGRRLFLIGITEEDSKQKAVDVQDDEEKWSVLTPQGQEVDHTYRLMCEPDILALLHRVDIGAGLALCLASVRQLARDTSPWKSAMHAVAAIQSIIDVLLPSIEQMNEVGYEQVMDIVLHHLTTALETLFQVRDVALSSLCLPERNRIGYYCDQILVQCVEKILHSGHLECFRSLVQFPLSASFSNESAMKLMEIMYGGQSAWDHTDNSTCGLVNKVDHGNLAHLALTESALPLSPSVGNLKKRLSAMPEEFQVCLMKAMVPVVECIDESTIAQMYLADWFSLGFTSETHDLTELCGTTLQTLMEKRIHWLSLVLGWIGNIQDSADSDMLVRKFLDSMPVSKWTPLPKDIEMLIALNCTQIRSRFAQTWTRIILDRVKWESPRIPRSCRVTLALGILEVTRKLEDESKETWATALWTTAAQTNFEAWAWKILSKLKLHAHENAAGISDDQTVSSWLDFDQDSALHNLRVLVGSDNPLAGFISLQLTQLGHSVPEICLRGWKILRTIEAFAPVELTIECVFNLSLSFLSCPEDLVLGKDFVNIFTTLLQRESTVFHSAKAMAGLHSQELVVDKVVKRMLQDISGGSKPCLNLWLIVLINLEQWNCQRPILYTLNCVAKAVFLERAKREMLISSLSNSFQTFIEARDGKQAAASRQNTSWIPGRSKGSVTLISSGICYDFPWIASLMLMAEDDHPLPRGTWEAVVDQVANDSTSEAEISKCLSQGPLKWTWNDLPIYRWCDLLLHMPSTSKDNGDHCAIAIVILQKLLTRYLARNKLGCVVGPYFFQGFVNSRYFEKIKQKTQELEGICGHDGGKQLFHAMYRWMDDAELLESKIHVPSLPKSLRPGLLDQAMSQNEDVWTDEITAMLAIPTPSQKSSSRDKSAKTSKSPPPSSNPHHNQVEPLSKGGMNSKKTETGASQWSGYGNTMSPYDPCHDLFSGMSESELMCIFKTQLCDYVGSIQGISEEVEYHLNQRSELLPKLFKQQSVDHILEVGCPMSFGLKGPRYCSGPAQIRLLLDTWVEQADIRDQLSDNFKNIQSHGQKVEKALTKPFLVILVALEQRIRELCAKGPISEGSLELFYSLVAILNEEGASISLVKDFFSTYMEMLAEKCVSNQPKQCLPLLKVLRKKPFLVGYLSSCFTPNVASPSDFLEIYSGLLSMEDEDIAFALLSKLSVNDWFSRVHPDVEWRNSLIDLLGRVLERDNGEDGQEQQESCQVQSLVRAKNRQTLYQLGGLEFPSHLFQIFDIFLNLTQNNSLEVDSWFDFIHLQHPDGAKSGGSRSKLSLNSSSREIQAYLKTSRQFVSNHHMDYLARQQIGLCALKMRDFFDGERHRVGLSGLYTKYADYYVPLTILATQLSQFLLLEALAQGNAPESSWRTAGQLFSPWIKPMKANEAQTSQWIQDLVPDHRMLLPWSLEDCSKAMLVAELFVLVSHEIGLECKDFSVILSCLWSMYVTSYANPPTSAHDHILEVIQGALAKLPWSTFRPLGMDFRLMNQVRDRDIMITHVFVSRIFLQVDWKSFLAQNTETLSTILPEFIQTLFWVRFGPNVGKNKELVCLALLLKDTVSATQMSASTYKELLHLFSTRVDSRVLANLEEGETFDSILIIFLSQVGKQKPISEEKIMSLIAMIVGLFEHCFKKFPKFAEDNEVRLARTFEWLLSLNLYNEAFGVSETEFPISLSSASTTTTKSEIHSLSAPVFVSKGLSKILESTNSKSGLSQFLVTCLTKVALSSLPKDPNAALIPCSAQLRLTCLNNGVELVHNVTVISKLLETSLIGLAQSDDPYEKAAWASIQAFWIDRSWPTMDSKKSDQILAENLRNGAILQLAFRTVLLSRSLSGGPISASHCALEWLRKLEFGLVPDEHLLYFIWLILVFVEQYPDQTAVQAFRTQLGSFLLALVRPTHGYSTQILDAIGLSAGYRPSPVVRLVFTSLLLLLTREDDDGLMEKAKEISREDICSLKTQVSPSLDALWPESVIAKHTCSTVSNDGAKASAVLQELTDPFCGESLSQIPWELFQV